MYQMSIFDFLPQSEQEFKIGDYIKEDYLGKMLSFDEIEVNIGKLIVMDMSTVSRNWYKVVLVEKIITYDGQRILIYFDGSKDRCIVNERYFKEDYPAGRRARAWDMRVCQSS